MGIRLHYSSLNSNFKLLSILIWNLTGIGFWYPIMTWLSFKYSGIHNPTSTLCTKSIKNNKFLIIPYPASVVGCTSFNMLQNICHLICYNVSSTVLVKLREIAEAYLGSPVKNAVVTVSASQRMLVWMSCVLSMSPLPLPLLMVWTRR